MIYFPSHGTTTPPNDLPCVVSYRQAKYACSRISLCRGAHLDSHVRPGTTRGAAGDPALCDLRPICESLGQHQHCR